VVTTNQTIEEAVVRLRAEDDASAVLDSLRDKARDVSRELGSDVEDGAEALDMVAESAAAAATAVASVQEPAERVSASLDDLGMAESELREVAEAAALAGAELLDLAAGEETVARDGLLVRDSLGRLRDELGRFVRESDAFRDVEGNMRRLEDATDDAAAASARQRREQERNTDETERARRSTSRLEQSIRSLIAAYLGFQGIRLVFNLSRDLSRAAADAEELRSRFGVTFRDLTDDAEDFSVAFAGALGRSRDQIRGALADFQVFFTGLGVGADDALVLSERTVQLGFDLASFFNATDDDALLRLRSALVGNAEALDAFGGRITAAEVLLRAQQRGLADNIQELSLQEQALLRLELIFERLNVTQNDAINTADSFTNRLKALQAVAAEARVEFGERLNEAILQGLDDAGGVETVENLVRTFFGSVAELARIGVSVGADLARRANELIENAGGPEGVVSIVSDTADIAILSLQRVGVVLQATLEGALSLVSNALDFAGIEISVEARSRRLLELRREFDEARAASDAASALALQQRRELLEENGRLTDAQARAIAEYGDEERSNLAAAQTRLENFESENQALLRLLELEERRAELEQRRAGLLSGADAPQLQGPTVPDDGFEVPVNFKFIPEDLQADFDAAFERVLSGEGGGALQRVGQFFSDLGGRFVEGFTAREEALQRTVDLAQRFREAQLGTSQSLDQQLAAFEQGLAIQQQQNELAAARGKITEDELLALEEAIQASAERARIELFDDDFRSSLAEVRSELQFLGADADEVAEAIQGWADAQREVVSNLLASGRLEEDEAERLRELIRLWEEYGERSGRGTKSAREGIESLLEPTQLASGIARELGDAFEGWATGAQSAEESFREATGQILLFIGRLIVQALIFKALTDGLGISFGGGGAGAAGATAANQALGGAAGAIGESIGEAAAGAAQKSVSGGVPPGFGDPSGGSTKSLAAELAQVLLDQEQAATSQAAAGFQPLGGDPSAAGGIVINLGGVTAPITVTAVSGGESVDVAEQVQQALLQQGEFLADLIASLVATRTKLQTSIRSVATAP